MTTTTPTTPAAIDIPADKLPPLEGKLWSTRDGRYRLYTVDSLPFDALPAYCDGGPAQVAHTDWAVAFPRTCRVFSSPSVVAADDGMITLDACKIPLNLDLTKDPLVVEHPLNGTKYPTQRDADRAAYNAGLTAFMVYERHARRYGLPAPALDASGEPTDI